MKKLICMFLCLVLLLSCLAGCAADSAKAVISEDIPKHIQEFARAKIGVTVGSVQGILLPQMLPDAELVEYNTLTDALMSLTSGKVDAIATEDAVYLAMRREGQLVSRVEEPIGISNYGIAFGKGIDPQLKKDFNNFLTDHREDGSLAELEEKWFGGTEPADKPDSSDLEGKENSICYAVESGQKPFSYMKDGKISGYDVELMILFAREYGYGLDIQDVSFAGILTGIEQGKYDMAGSGITITEERKESMDFSDPYHTEEMILVVHDPNTGNSRTLADFHNGTLGVIDGSLYAGFSRELFPEAQIDSYASFTDLFQCVKQGKIDGFLMDIPNFSAVARTDPNLSYLTVPGYSVDIGIAFGKNQLGETLQKQMNEFLATIQSDGTYDQMWEYWCTDTEPVQPPVLPDLSGNTEELSIVFDLSRKPFVYLLNNEYAGFEVDLMYRFCEAYGYKPVCQSGQWIAGIAGLKEEKYDVLSCGIYMTEERKESVNFCDPYVTADVIMVIYEGGGNSTGFLDSIKESFEKTFIREDRWKLIAEGILNTLMISLAAIILGTALGFGLYLLARCKYPTVSGITKAFAKVYARLISGTPTLVVLMILFYIVFSEWEGIVVAVLGFALTFGSSVYSNLMLSVYSIDRGQTEAAYALGYTRNSAFFRVVLPQALKLFLPNFTGEAVGLVKATSVVGYIAVNDLTKMGDIIRSNTYEAFFPLIAVAVIYFMITWGVAELLGILQKKTDFHRRKKEDILKGVIR